MVMPELVQATSADVSIVVIHRMISTYYLAAGTPKLVWPLISIYSAVYALFMIMYLPMVFINIMLYYGA